MKPANSCARFGDFDLNHLPSVLAANVGRKSPTGGAVMAVIVHTGRKECPMRRLWLALRQTNRTSVASSLHAKWSIGLSNPSDLVMQVGQALTCRSGAADWLDLRNI